MKVRFWRLASIACALTCLHAQHEKSGEKARHPFMGDPMAIEAGRKQFASGCAGCHGPDGGGGRGPNLRDRVFWHPLDDQTLYGAIQKGVGVMPGANLPEDDAWRVVAYVRSLTSPAFEVQSSGNVEAGRTMFWGSAGCSGCHTIQGKGGKVGPDLSNIGLKSTLPKLRQSILQPDQEISAGFQTATILLRTGEKLQGAVKNRSNYSIQLQEPSGALRLIDAGQVEQLVLKRTTAMPLDYKTRLSHADIDNMLAYLAKQAAGAPVLNTKR